MKIVFIAIIDQNIYRFKSFFKFKFVYFSNFISNLLSLSISIYHLYIHELPFFTEVAIKNFQSIDSLSLLFKFIVNAISNGG